MPKFGNGSGIVGFGEVAAIGACVNEDEASNVEVTLVKGLDGEERMIDGAESGAGGDENRKLKFGHEVEHGFFPVKGDEGASGAFDKKSLYLRAKGVIGVD